ncbi:NRDE family protein [Aspergillus undulatus]|uniref:NRDE family protein n=1 Tax=Aspergillus undulatus TaxID=1810928 RepID=UPI003CCDAAF7
MCIAILSTTHPDYRYIILNNRDEFLSRPTAPSKWWTPSTTPPGTITPILSALDLARPAHGTWMGINGAGRLGVLTNCLERSCAKAVGGLSRGAVVRKWLTESTVESTDRKRGGIEDFVEELENMGDVGGFNLLLGDASDAQGRVAIVSNRSTGTECCPEDQGYHGKVKVQWVSRDSGSGEGEGETIALSNMTLGEHSPKWKKMSLGEDLTSYAISTSVEAQDDEDTLVERLFNVLSTDTLPRLPEGLEVDSAEAYLGLLKESIYIPVIGKPVVPHEKEEGEVVNSTYMEGLYGTQTQTVMLVAHSGKVRFVARTLYDDAGRRLGREEGVQEFVFAVD